MASITLLGPQHNRPMVSDLLEEMDIDGPLALITAGWEEREEEQEDEVERLVGDRPTVNLRLYARWEEVFRREPELGQAMRDRNDRLRTIQRLYRRRLDPAVEAVWELHQMRVPRMELLLAERHHALRALSDLDHHYLEQIRAVHTAFEDVWDPNGRPTVVDTRAQVREEVRGCSAILIAGGDVGVITDRLRLFGLHALIGPRPVIAWSAGAMALSERIVLFHDSPPYGQGNAELYDDGLGLVPKIVALPHASSRLRLDDRQRVSIFARRFAPATCVALDAGCGITWDGESWRAFGRTRRLNERGQVVGMVAP